MRRLIIFLLTVLSTPMVGLAQKSEKEDLQFLIIEAITKNPDIAAAVYAMRVWEEKIPQAGALDDPQFTYKLMEFPGTQFNEAVYQNYELMQMIMFPTKLFTRKDIASIRAEHAHHQHLEKEIRVIAELKSTYAMLWAARENRGINLENQRLLQQILNTAQTQYAVGKVSQQEVLKTSIELSKLKTQEALIQQEVVSSESMMLSILNRPTDASIGIVEYDSLEPVQRSLGQLLGWAIKNRPMVIHDSLGVTEGDLMVSMARQEYLPDFKFAIERVTMPMTKVNTWTVMAGISIPFAPWSLAKASARVQEATAERSMRESMYKATQNMVTAQIRDAYARVKSLETQVNLLEGTIIPQTRQSLFSLIKEYQTGTTPYIMLIDGYRTYQEMKMETVMARMKYEQELAQLEQQVGVTNLNIIPPASKEEQQ